MLRMHVASKLLSRILQILNILKIVKRIKKYIIFKTIRGNFRIKKSEYMWKSPVRCIRVQNFQQIPWKMTECWRFEDQKRTFFTLFLRFSDLKICLIWAFQKAFYDHFSRSWRKTNQKTCITPPKPKIFSLTSLWPRDLEWPWPWICSQKA